MHFTEAISICFRKYAVFKGRAGKAEFWWWMLFVLIAPYGLDLIDDSLSLIFMVGTLLPSAAVATRRLHDTNRGGWSQLVGLIPVVGWVLIIVWLAQDAREPNRFND